MTLTASVKSAVRVIEIFEFFESSREPRSQKEIIEHLQYPQSSSTVLLKSLVSMGYLSYDCQLRKYFPTPRLARLGDWVSGSLFGEGRVLKLMSRVHEATGELVGMGIQNDINLQYLKIIQPGHALPYFVPEGNMRLLTQSAGGWALLSRQPARRVDYTVRRVNLQASRPEERVNVPQFLELIAQVRRDGYAYAEDIPFDGCAALCMPLPVTLKGQPAVIGIAGRSEVLRPRKAEFVELLRKATAALAEDGPLDDLDLTPEVMVSPSVAANPAGGFAGGHARNWFDALGQFDDRGGRIADTMSA